MKKLLHLILLSVMTIGLYAQEEILLYPYGAAESNGIEEEKWRDSDFLFGGNVARMYTYIAPQEISTGTAVVICPGGGYSGVSAVKEGKEFAEWLNDLGISAFVLYYRMPNGHSYIPLKDAQTAMEIVYDRAEEWNIDRDKIGVAGFSAGGHLASTLGTHFTSEKNRPDFMILAYPVITMNEEFTHMGSRNNLIGQNPSKELEEKFSNELQVTPETSRTFIVATEDDKVVSVKNSREFFDALKRNKVPATIKIYEKGVHGFAFRPQDLPVDQWLDVLKFWLQSNDYVK